MSVLDSTESTVELSLEAVAPVSAGALRRSLVSDRMIDDALAQAGDSGVSITGREGLLNEIIRAVLERGLSVELDDHLGYEKGDPAGRGSPNSRNGFTPKTLGTQVGDVPLTVPRDRQGTFSPVLVPKGVPRMDGLGRDDHQLVRGRDDDPRYPVPPHLDAGDGPVGGDDLQHHRRGR